MSPDQLVDQLHRVLVDEIRVRRPEYLKSPFTVAEIYQDLVPYRTHRDRIGASMNGDYEHALLRLLAGAGDYLRIESEPARKRMLEELGASNPNTGLFREFAALDVRLNPAYVPSAAQAANEAAPRAATEDGGEAAGGSAGPTRTGAASRGEDGNAAAPAPAARERDEAARAADPSAAPTGSAPTSREGSARTATPQAPESCRWCREDLPKRANLRFCPFCGTDVNLVPCPSCGEELDSSWRFCIACGTEVTPE